MKREEGGELLHIQARPYAAGVGGGGAGGQLLPPEIFKAIFFYTQFLYFQIVLSVNQKIMQLQVK